MKTTHLLVGSLVFLLLACSPSSMPSATQVAVPALPTALLEPSAPAGINALVEKAPAFTSIHMINEMDGWAVTETQVVHTGDGGVTWYNVTPPGLGELGYGTVSDFLDRDHAFVHIMDPDDPINGTLYRTSDGGQSWNSNPVPFGRGFLRFLDPANGWMMADRGVGAGNMGIAIFQTADGGQSWTQTYTNDPNFPDAKESLPLGGLKNTFTPLNMQTAWVGGVTYATGLVYLYRTDDAGYNWSLVSMTLPDDARELSFNVNDLQFVTEVDAFLVVRMSGDVTRQIVYVTHDGGGTWSQTPALIPQGGSADFTSREDGVIYNGDQFYITRDAAQTWTMVAPDIAFGDSFSYMDFVNSSTGWVMTMDANGHQSLYRTSDGGVTWSALVP